MVKLILSDMDGTLVDDEGRLPKDFDEVMEQLKERGVLFAPASGRQYFSLLKTFEKYADDFVFLAENGTVVMYQGKELFSMPMDKEKAFEVLDAAQADFPVFCGKHGAYVLRSHARPEFVDELMKYYTSYTLVDDFREIVDDVPVKVALYDYNGRAKENILPSVQQFDGPLQVVRSSDWWIDVMSVGLSKGVAVQAVQKLWKLSPEECAAFGDYMNDAEMMDAVYYSYAMENAHPKIKERARFSTKSNAEAGVLWGIRELMEKGLC